jgi:hypothetical protein
MIAGSPIVVYLHSPREKLWGLMLDLSQAGVFLHGIDINTFDDWLQMIVRGERNIGLSHLFIPMWRVERITLDETLDDLASLADRFHDRVGLSIHDYLAGS